MQIRTSKPIILSLLLLFSCQTGRKDTTNKKDQNEIVISQLLEKKQTPLQKYQNCIKETPLNINCHWQLGWVHYMEANWSQVQTHWNIARYLTKSKKFQALLDKKLILINDLAALESLSQNFPQQNRSLASVEKNNSFLTISLVGDVMIGTDNNQETISHLKNDPFKKISHLFNADLKFANLEGMFCDLEKKKSKCKKGSKNCFSFRTPKKYFKYIKKHFNMISLANNHALDFGKSCQEETEVLAEKSSIMHSNGDGNHTTKIIKGKKVSFIAFHTNSSLKYNVTDIKEAKKTIKKLKKESDIVILSFHGGSEGHTAVRIPFTKEFSFGTNRGDLRKFSHAVIDSGADLVIGHGPHIIRGVENYKNKLIVYSLGNFLTYDKFNLSGLLKFGMHLKVELDEKGNFLIANVDSTKQIGRGIASTDKENNSFNYLKTLTKLDFPNTEIIFSNKNEFYNSNLIK